MSILKTDYEISVWDYLLSDNNQFEEKRIAIIGSSSMTSQYRVLNPQIKKGINGVNEFTFQIYSQYKDSISGDKVINPFVQYLINERIIRVRDGKDWYDFLIKEVQQDSSSHMYHYVATDRFVNELFKNGFDIELNDKNGRGSGTAKELAEQVLTGTGWDVQSDNIPQTTEEALVKISLTERPLTNCCKIDDTDEYKPTPSDSPYTIPQHAVIYGFYSCCRNKSPRFQFLYFTSDKIEVNEDNVAIAVGQQYYCDIEDVDIWYAQDKEQMDLVKYDLYIPHGSFGGIADFRGKRYVYTQKSHFHSGLNRYVFEYTGKDSDGAVKEYYGYETTKTFSPTFVQNLITSGDCANTSGWTALGTTEVSLEQTPSVDDYMSGEYPSDDWETETRHWLAWDGKTGLLNSGFTDNFNHVENLTAQDEYMVMWRWGGEDPDQGQTFTLQVGDFNYSSKTFNQPAYLTFVCNSEGNNNYNYEFETEPGKTKIRQYKYATANCTTSKTIEELLAKTPTILITTDGAGLELSEIWLFKVSRRQNGSRIFPFDPIETVVIKEQKFFLKDESNDQQDAKSIEYVTQSSNKKFAPVYGENAQKIMSIEAKESNRFNIIQQICEIFQCWADFIIDREDNGRIKSKTLYLKNYVSKYNHAGFRYGVNLKGIKRNISSQEIVTKLIVPNANNEFAPNGFCSIARAGGNEIGENYIYNFSYYIHHGLIDKDKLQKDLWDLEGQEGPDISEDPSTKCNCNGYYARLSKINAQYALLEEKFVQQSQVYIRAQSDLKLCQTTIKAAEEELLKLYASFQRTAGFPFAHGGQKLNESQQNKISASEYLTSTVAKIMTLIARKNSEQEKEPTLQQNELTAKGEYDSLVAKMNKYRGYKAALNAAFFEKYGRFIQEGTWNDDEYIDEEKYYLDAVYQAQMAGQPRSTYTIDTVAVDALPGYEGFVYNIGEKTWVEDEELFGRNPKTNAPYRKEVIITELTRNLDNPSKNTFKVQIGSDKFDDIFKKIQASVQSVSFAKGAWENSTLLLDPNSEMQKYVMQSYYSSNTAPLYNAGDPTTSLTEQGIISTNTISPNQLLRMSNGRIYSKDTSKPNAQWETIVDADGIDGSRITKGALNVNQVTIGIGDDPAFRIDSLGMSAFAPPPPVTDSSTSTPKTRTNSLPPPDEAYCPSQWVRFDKYGLYGRHGTDGTYNGDVWKPGSLEEIEENAHFGLTWNGFFINGLGDGQFTPYGATGSRYHYSTARLGKAGEYLYNSWDEKNGAPIWDSGKTGGDFVRVMAVGPEKENPTFELFDDGTIKANKGFFKGEITATKLTIAENADISGLPTPTAEQVLSGWLYDPDDEDNTNQTTIEGGAISTSAIAANRIAVNALRSKGYNGPTGASPYSQTGTEIDLTNGSITTPSFVLGPSGSAYFKGHVEAESGSFEGRVTAKCGTIGGFSIGPYWHNGQNPSEKPQFEEGLYYPGGCEIGGDSNGFYLIPEGARSGANPFGQGIDHVWTMLMGENFGLDNSGGMHVRNATVYQKLNIKSVLDFTEDSFIIKEGQIGRAQQTGLISIPESKIEINSSSEYQLSFVITWPDTKIVWSNSKDDYVTIVLSDETGNNEQMDKVLLHEAQSRVAESGGEIEFTIHGDWGFKPTRASINIGKFTYESNGKVFMAGGNFSPTSENVFSLGDTEHQWKALYTQNIFLNEASLSATIQDLKSKISTLENKIDILEQRIKALKP